MSKVAVVTDSIAAIPAEMARKYGITTVAAHVIMDGRDYPDTEMDMAQLYDRLEQKDNLPTTSAVTTSQFLQAYRDLSQKAEAILVITLTAAYSATYGTAIKAAEMVAEELPNTTIKVIDSRTAASAQLLIVLEAARAAAQDKSLQEVIKTSNEMIPRVNDFSTRDTLFFIDKGGLAYDATAWAKAETESQDTFRAILKLDASTDGITKPVARAKTRAQIMEKMVSLVEESTKGKKLHAAIVHTNVTEQAEQLKKLLLSQLQCEEFYIAEAFGATAVKNGRGMMQLGFYGSD